MDKHAVFLEQLTNAQSEIKLEVEEQFIEITVHGVEGLRGVSYYLPTPNAQVAELVDALS